MGRRPNGTAPSQPESLEQAEPELIKRLRADPYDYFRFVNRSWIARACDIRADVRDLPVVRLNGDAHVEKSAVAQNAWGLDDFDDSARGPAAIDIVRFLGSIDLVVRQRSWEKDRDSLLLDLSKVISGVSRSLTIGPLRRTSCVGDAPRRHRHAGRFLRGARPGRRPGRCVNQGCRRKDRSVCAGRAA